MKRKSDAEKLTEYLNENPQGVSKSWIMRECDIHSESSFFDILKMARISNEIETLKNGHSFDPNDLQKKAVETIDDVGLYIIEAPMEWAKQKLLFGVYII